MSFLQPNFVTFTGIDKFTDLNRCKDLSDRYPIEWGVLFSSTNKSNRYPNYNQRCNIASAGLNLSAHLCGEISRRFQEDLFAPSSIYKRIQVNAGKYKDLDWLNEISIRDGRRVIIQHREGPFPIDGRFDYLVDKSGGRGRVANFLPPQHDINHLVGYSGGITPGNVRHILSNITALHYWIDMETGIRTDDKLDLNKCEAICKTIWSRNVK